MATYVFSDVHGHRAALERVLMRVSPVAGDAIFCLGDMIDRGPDPIGVLRLVRALPGATALIGNHEDLMLDGLRNQNDPIADMNWAINGGAVTAQGLDELARRRARRPARLGALLPEKRARARGRASSTCWPTRA